jgi:hypothetical protein
MESAQNSQEMVLDWVFPYLGSRGALRAKGVKLG